MKGRGKVFKISGANFNHHTHSFIDFTLSHYSSQALQWVRLGDLAWIIFCVVWSTKDTDHVLATSLGFLLIGDDKLVCGQVLYH